MGWARDAGSSGTLGFETARITQGVRQTTGNHIAQMGNEQGAERAAEVMFIKAANRQQSLTTLIIKRHHGGRLDLVGMLGKQFAHLVVAQNATYRFALT